MAKNKMSDLTDHLFMQLERLSDDEYMKDNAEMEIERAKAVAAVSKNLVETAKIIVVAAKLKEQLGTTEHVGMTKILS